MKIRLTILLCLLLPTAVWATVPPGYYDSAFGLNKGDLKETMRGIVAKGVKMLSYGSGAGKTWTGFYSTDRYEGNRVRDRYSNQAFYFSSSSTATAASAVSGMNIEHSFPKSWWGGASNNAYKDLFNLMPCEQKINSSKSNYAMGKVQTARTDNGCTKVGSGKAGSTNATLWEPADQWKGDFARTYFYMVTAYSNLTWEGEALKMLDNNVYPTMKSWAAELLLEWSRTDPVDEIETQRNEAVYKIQGNRNPFIDYPNLAEFIWGDSVEYAFNVHVEDDVIDDPVEPELEDIDLMAVDFTKDSEGWTVKDELKDDDFGSIWFRHATYGMTASAYKTHCTASESWLISPELDLRQLEEASLTFSHTGKMFGDMKEEATLWYSTDDGETWSQLPITTYMKGTDWVFVTNVTDLAPCLGKRVKLGFRYTSSVEYAGKWEIKTLSVDGKRQHCDMPGDVDGNGKLTPADILALRQVLLGDKTRVVNRVAADVNEDGEVSLADLTLLINLLSEL